MEYWNDETIRFMEEASEYGDFHEKLAQRITPFLPKSGHICEAGCGLGYLSRELAKLCRQVTAADASQRAMDFLMSRPLPENLSPLCIDAFRLEGPYDAMVFCYFGRMEEILQIAKKSCRETVVVAKRNCAARRFSLKQNTLGLEGSTAERIMEDRGVPFKKFPLALEFGQPFRTVEDGVAFFRLHDRSGSLVTPEAVLPRLQPLEHPVYSWYLPSRREMNLYIFSAKDIS